MAKSKSPAPRADSAPSGDKKPSGSSAASPKKRASSVSSKKSSGNASDLQILGAIVLCMQSVPTILAFYHMNPSLAENHVTLFATGSFFICSTVYLYYYVLFKHLKLQPNLPALFFCFNAWASYVDMFLSTSQLTRNQPLGRFYLEKGEKYFNSAYGFICLFYDGTVQAPVEALLGFLAVTKREYHFLGLAWAGSIINSMGPLLIGAATGPFSGEIQMATAFNGPFVLAPIAICIMLLANGHMTRKKPLPGSKVRSHNLLADLVLLVYNIVLSTVHIIRLMCVLGSESKIAKQWSNIEPVLDQNNFKDKDDLQDFSFMRAQVMQWAFWFVLWHWAAVYEQVERIRTGKRTILLGSMGVDLSAVVLGGYIQSTVCHLVTSNFDMKPATFGIFLREGTLSQEFWLINISTLVGALLHFTHFHVQDVEEAKED